MKFRNIFTSAILLVAVFASVQSTQAQELQANVTVNMEALPLDQRDDIITMKQDLENYLNNQRYTDADWEGPKIPVDITVYILGRSGNRYNARLFVVSKRTLDGGGSSGLLKIFDDKWSFPYMRNANLTYQPMRYDEFSSLVDFYMLIAIGMDLDTWGELEGRQLYTQAQQIAQLGASKSITGFSSYYQPGEFTRFALISELNDLRFDEFRKQMYAYHAEGLDYLKSDEAKGKDGVMKAINGMSTFKKNKTSSPSALIQAFFEAKYGEIATLFKSYKNKELFDHLTFLDPTHSSNYLDARDAR
ncbi:MAG TPA: DUF4835 family protein [Patescibacteria group bacterium]|nr:DUF4835 family protein [Patescibacteria group bacterium]